MPNTQTAITVSAKLLDPFLQLARHFPQSDGSDVAQQLLQQAGLSEAEFNKPGARFPEDKFPLVLEKLEAFSGNPLIALNLGEVTQPQMLGSLGFLMSTAPNLELAYQILADYLPLIHEGALLQLEKRVDQLVLTFELHDNHPGILRFFLSCLINWPRHLTGQQVAARHVHLTCAEPEDARLYQQHFAAEVSFAQHQNQLILNSKYLQLSCVDANAEMHQLHREFADSLMSKIGVQNALTARTRNLIRQHLSSNNGLIRREQVAAELGLSLRTLQRKLGVLGSSFQDIYDDTRKEVCLQLIQRGEHSFGEISYQLGFSNQSAFQKAFKRWMETTPSEYRSRIQPELMEISVSKPVNQATRWLHSSDFNQQLARQVEHLSQFSCQLLEWAALCGDTFNLEQVSALTADPIARLAIYLWPAEQSGLIVCTDDPGDRTHFRFADPRILQRFLASQSDELLSQRHYTIAATMLARKISYFSADTLFHHIEQARTFFSAPELQQIAGVALESADSAAKAGNFHRACYFQNQVLESLPSSTDAEYEKQYWRLAELLLLAGDASAAQTKVDQFEQPGVTRALLQARIFQHQNASDKALQHLLTQLNELPAAEDESAQLRFLVEHAEVIREQLPQLAAVHPKQPEQNSSDLQQLLEQIVLLAREQNQPLLAACAICLMVNDTLAQGRTVHSAFALASFAWVASWFCADIALAKDAAAASRLLLSAQQEPAPLSNPIAQHQDPSLILSSQVEHWLLPLEKVQRNLNELENSCRSKHHWLELLDLLTFSYQMHIFRSGTPLDQLLTALEQALDHISHPDLAQKKHSIQHNIATCIGRLQGTTMPDTLTEPLQGHFACSRIVSALILNEQPLWATMLATIDSLEQSLPGYFSHTEALFATTLMRAILAQQQGGFSPKGQIEFTRQRSRIEIWARQVPDNFAAQYLLLQAEQARLENNNPSPFYESALSQLNSAASGYLLPLCYQRYADYLRSCKQTHLAAFCLQHARQQYHDWGAIKAAKLVEQQLSLLAK